MKATSPYFDTYLQADVRISPTQMNNNILGNIKTNLVNEYKGKCFLQYGFVEKIYEIDEDIKDGEIRPEDSTSSSVHRVKFGCRICNPIKNSFLMAQIGGINNKMIYATLGPIRFIIPADNINNKNIKFYKSAFYPIDHNGQIIDTPIKEGKYVILQVLDKKIVNRNNHINCLAILESYVPDDDVEAIMEKQYRSNDPIDGQKLIKGELTEIYGSYDTTSTIITNDDDE